MTRICRSLVDGAPCERPTVEARSPYCTWHRLARTTLPGQETAARARLAAAPVPHRPRVPATEWPPGDRWCAGCQSMVPLWYCTGSRCTACARAKRGETRRRAVYGITEEDWEALLKLQGYRCAICRHRSRDRAPAAEHDHGTQAMRGACCKRCNHDLLGGAADSPRRIASALIYLLAPPASGDWVRPEDCLDEVLAVVEQVLATKRSGA